MDQTRHIPSDLPGVRLIDARHQHFSFPRHFHLEYHVGLMVEGRQRYLHQGESHHADTGDVMLMAPEQIHDGAGVDGQGYQIRVLAFDPQWLDDASRSLSDDRQGAPRLTTSILRDAGLRNQLLELHRALLQGARLEQESHLWSALASLLERGSNLRVREPEQGFDGRTWARLRDWLESRLDTPPSLEELAAFCELSPWQALRRFNRQCGLPPHQWLTQLRLEKALPRVLRGENLSEVALDLGFYDQAHFSRLFRRTYGAPPAKLRSR